MNCPQLLEDHLKSLREVDSGSAEDDESAWQGWDIDSCLSDESDETDRWIDVHSDADDLNISDSDAEHDRAETGKDKIVETESDNAPSTLATTRVWYSYCCGLNILIPFAQILTPADFALLNDLRIQAATKAVESGGGSIAKRKLAALAANKKIVQAGQSVEDAFISENDILGPRKKAKSDYAARLASVEKGREGREKFGSHKGKKTKDVPSSSTNRAKTRNKPIMMIISSGNVRNKKKASLREKQQRLRRHIDKGKRSHH